MDDDPLNNMLGSHNIKRYITDADVKSFEFPAEALSFIRSEYSDEMQHIPTILFLDINMPDIDGWEFLVEFEKMSSHIHSQFVIYIVSSSVDSEDRQKARDNKFVKDFLSKPLNNAILENISRGIINSV